MTSAVSPEKPGVASHYEGVRCIAWRQAPHGHTLVGFCDLAWSGFKFHDVSVHARADGVWVSFPMRSRGRDNPQRMIHFERQELYDAWQVAAVAAVLAFPGVESAIQAMEKRLADE
jgi:hypothetical protein